MSFLPENTLGSYLEESVVLPTDNDDLRAELTTRLESILMMLNRKETASYEQIEQLINQLFFGANPQSKRSIFRKIISTGTLPDVATTTTEHGITGITNGWMFTRMTGFAIDAAVPRWIFIPNGGSVYPIGIWADNTRVYLESTVNLSTFTTSYVILEYWKV